MFLIEVPDGERAGPVFNMLSRRRGQPARLLPAQDGNDAARVDRDHPAVLCGNRCPADGPWLRGPLTIERRVCPKSLRLTNRLTAVLSTSIDLTHALQRKPLTGRALRSKWTGPGLNRRHTDFQSVALPTELPVRLSKAYRGLSWNQPLQTRQPARLAPAPLVGARSRVVNAEKPRSDSTTDMSHAALRACSAEAIACKIIA